MVTIVNGLQIAQQIEDRLKEQVYKLKKKNIIPKLIVVLVGDNQASATYVCKKGEVARRIGLDFCLKEYDSNISQEDLILEIKKIQKEKLAGLMVQLPLPDHLNSREIINHINSDIDVDCLTESSWGKLAQGVNVVEPPTAGAMMEVIKHYNVDLIGKEVVIIGRGELVGRPLSMMLMRKNCTVTVCHRSTKDLSFHTKRADVIFTGVGRYNTLTGDMIKDDAVVIDAGVCFHESKMYGDIDFDTISKKASLVTPTPKGIGPITVAKLLENCVKTCV